MRFLAAGLLLLSGPAAAATIVLDFTSPAPGEYETLAYPEVLLSEWTASRGLYITDDPAPFLVVGADAEGGTLLLTFLAPVIGVELTFGGDSDDPNVTAGPATLVGIGGGAFVDITSVVPNRNGLIDQTLTIGMGVVMDSALFRFRQLGLHEPESPWVGQIILHTATVPEPALGLLLSLAPGLAAAATVVRARRIESEVGSARLGGGVSDAPYRAAPVRGVRVRLRSRTRADRVREHEEGHAAHGRVGRGVQSK
jgi:hypothetical protein